MRGAVAAGHPLTAEVGAEILKEGGNAVDACVAAGFASAATESPLTGLGGGGFMLVHRAGGGSARLADFFVAEPGLGSAPHDDAAMQEIDVGFGEGSTTQVFRIGPASCAVPGLVAGLAEAHRAYGRLPWRELVAPAAALARGGVELTRSQAHMHAVLDPILRFGDEGKRVYGQNGSRLVAGDRLRLPDLADTLDAIGRRGAAALYAGSRARAIVSTVRDGGGALTLEDLREYRVVWRRPVGVPFHEHEVLLNPPPSSGGLLIAYGLALLEGLGPAEPGRAAAVRDLIETMREQNAVRGPAFVRGLHRGGLPRRLLAEPTLLEAVARIRERAAARGDRVPAPIAGTTHVSVVDVEGNAASLSTSTGSGSGVIVAGTGIYLNNMLGETDLATGALPAGRRLTSMMAPSIALNPDGSPRLVVGSAGSARLRGAIMQVVVKVLGHGMSVHDAIGAPRVHLDEPHVHCEGGHDPEMLDGLEAAGYDLVRWRRRNLFFGGASAVEIRADGS